jgi:transposase-like protein
MRRQYSELDREGLFAEMARSGDPLARCAKRLRISVSTAYAWASVRKASQQVTFAQVMPASNVTLTTSRPGLTLRIGQVEIDLHPGFDAVLLRSVLDALGKVS